MSEKLQQLLFQKSLPLSEIIRNISQQNQQLDDFIKKIQQKIVVVRLIPEVSQKIDMQINDNVQFEAIIQRIFSNADIQLEQQYNLLTNNIAQIAFLINFYNDYLLIDQRNPISIQKSISPLENILKESQQTQYIPSRTRKLLETFCNNIKARQKQHLKNLVKVSKNNIVIDLKGIKDNTQILDEDILRNFTNKIFSLILSYTILTKNYEVMILNPEINLEKQIIYAKIIPVLFQKQDSNHFFVQIQSAMTQSIKIFQTLAKNIVQIEPSMDKFLVSQKKKCIAELRKKIEYVFAYFSIQNRKNILSLLDTDVQQLSISDILVKLKLKGQDGDTLSHSIDILCKKLKDNQQDIQVLFDFFEILITGENFLNLGLYITSQLIQNLQDDLQYGYTKKILTFRQNFRTKLHHPKNDLY